MLDLGREGGNVVFQALLVTDEGIHAAEPGQMRTGGRGHGQAAQGHGHAQAQGLEADGLAAGVAAGDDEGPFAGTQHDVQRAHLLQAAALAAFVLALAQADQGQQGMAGLQQADAFLHGRERHAAAVVFGGQAALGLQNVQLGQQFQGGTRPGQFGQQQAAQIGQHLVLFLALLAFQLLEAVVDLHQEHGLEIAGLAGLGPVMDDALHAALEVGLEGQHIAVRGQGHELVLQPGQHIVLHGVVLDPAHAVLVQAAQFAAHLEEFGRALVADQAVIGDAAQQGRRELHGQRRFLGQGQQVRPLILGFGQGDGGMGGLGQPQHLAQGPEGIGIGLQAGLFGHPQEGAHIGEGPQGKAALAHGTGGPDGGFVIQARRVGDGGGVFQRTQLKSTLAAGRGKAQAGEVLRDLREFERVESAAVDHGCS